MAKFTSKVKPPDAPQDPAGEAQPPVPAAPGPGFVVLHAAVGTFYRDAVIPAGTLSDAQVERLLEHGAIKPETEATPAEPEFTEV